jgi:hypothetical protein
MKITSSLNEIEVDLRAIERELITLNRTLARLVAVAELLTAPIKFIVR